MTPQSFQNSFSYKCGREQLLKLKWRLLFDNCIYFIILCIFHCVGLQRWAVCSVVAEAGSTSSRGEQGSHCPRPPVHRTQALQHGGLSSCGSHSSQAQHELQEWCCLGLSCSHGMRGSSQIQGSDTCLLHRQGSSLPTESPGKLRVTFKI